MRRGHAGARCGVAQVGGGRRAPNSTGQRHKGGHPRRRRPVGVRGGTSSHLGAVALLTLHLLEPLALLRLRVRDRHLLHHLALALELVQLHGLRVLLRLNLLSAHLADLGALNHLLLITEVLLSIHPPDRVLLLLVPPLLRLHLSQPLPLLHLDLPLALLHDVRKHEL